MKTAILFAAAQALISMPMDARKKERPATQEPIVKGCIQISEIRSHRMGLTVGPGLDAMVDNGCDGPMRIIVSIAYYDNSEIQFKNGRESATVAPGTRWQLQHRIFDDEDARRLKTARIIGVTVIAQR
jgi:hypothetical protein